MVTNQNCAHDSGGVSLLYCVETGPVLTDPNGGLLVRILKLYR